MKMFSFKHAMRLGAVFILVSISTSPAASSSSECCEKGFVFEDVLRYARTILPTLTERYESLLIIPTGADAQFTIATTSEESIEFRYKIVTRLRRRNSHAFLLKTPLGVSLHYWNAGSAAYRHQTLIGRDLFDEEFVFGRVAWVEGRVGLSPRLSLVSGRLLDRLEARSFTKEVMKKLGESMVSSQVRTDAYYWPSGGSVPYSLPILWRTGELANFESVSQRFWLCRIDESEEGGVCQ